MINFGNLKNTVVPVRLILKGFLVVSLVLSLLFYFGSKREADSICLIADCIAAVIYITAAHEILVVQHTMDEFDDDLDAFQNWLIDIFLGREVGPATGQMLTQMAASAMQYTQIIGEFLDAQIQMDTQRVMRKLLFDAHKDYVPSQTFCHFGTNVRSLAATESRGRFNALTLSKMSLDRQMGISNMAGSNIKGDDYKARWNQFIKVHCDPRDNNFQLGGQNGLILACGSGGADNNNRINRDINYTRLIDKPRTLNVDFNNTTLNVQVEPFASKITGAIHQPGDEEDVIALSKNLYGNKVLSRGLSRKKLKKETAKKLYIALRSVAAKRNVAQASYNAIVALKSSGTTHEHEEDVSRPTMTGPVTVDLETKQTRRFMAAIIRELVPASSEGVYPVDPNDEWGDIFDLIGYSPSYYSQLEILAKRIYQNPNFYVNLYETPANIARKKVAMKAIELMVDRAIYESQIRREMSISVLLASKLRALHRDTNKGLTGAVGE